MARTTDPMNEGTAGRRSADPQRSAEELKRKTAESLGEARARGEEQLEEKLEQGKSAAGSQAERVASAFQRTAEDLEAQGDRSLAGYAAEISRGVQSLAETLRHKSVSDIATDMEDLARRNPTTFLLGSVAVGLALGRFMKASAHRAHQPQPGVAMPAEDSQPTRPYPQESSDGPQLT